MTKRISEDAERVHNSQQGWPSKEDAEEAAAKVRKYDTERDITVVKDGKWWRLNYGPYKEVKESKDTHMTLTVKLLEAIRAKDWHTANVLFEQSMQERMVTRIDDIKTRVMMEDEKRCEMCGSKKNVRMVDDTPICKECDVEESEELNSMEKGDGTDNGGLKECATCGLKECNCK